MAFLQWLISTVIGSFSKGAADYLLERFKLQQTRADQTALGAATQAHATDQAVIAAQQRMEAAQSKPADDATTLDKLDHGKF